MGTLKVGIAYGISQSVTYFMLAGCFYLAAYLVENKGEDFNDLFK